MDLDYQESTFLIDIPVVVAKFSNDKITDILALYLKRVVLSGLLCQLDDNSLRFFISCVI